VDIRGIKGQFNHSRFLLNIQHSISVFCFVLVFQMSLKCRKCRQVLVTQHDALLTAHGEPVGTSAPCAAVQFGAVFYLQEDQLPAWIGAVVDKVCIGHTCQVLIPRVMQCTNFLRWEQSGN
jgi:hypothetical protein